MARDDDLGILQAEMCVLILKLRQRCPKISKDIPKNCSDKIVHKYLKNLQEHLQDEIICWIIISELRQACQHVESLEKVIQPDNLSPSCLKDIVEQICTKLETYERKRKKDSPQGKYNVKKIKNKDQTDTSVIELIIQDMPSNDRGIKTNVVPNVNGKGSNNKYVVVQYANKKHDGTNICHSPNYPKDPIKPTEEPENKTDDLIKRFPLDGTKENSTTWSENTGNTDSTVVENLVIMEFPYENGKVDVDPVGSMQTNESSQQQYQEDTSLQLANVSEIKEDVQKDLLDPKPFKRRRSSSNSVNEALCDHRYPKELNEKGKKVGTLLSANLSSTKERGRKSALEPKDKMLKSCCQNNCRENDEYDWDFLQSACEFSREDLRAFIIKQVDVIPCSTQSAQRWRNRSCRRVFHLPGANNEQITVCKRFFMEKLKVNSDIINIALKNKTEHVTKGNLEEYIENMDPDKEVQNDTISESRMKGIDDNDGEFDPESLQSSTDSDTMDMELNDIDNPKESIKCVKNVLSPGSSQSLHWVYNESS